MKILVTGAAGFLGSEVVRVAREQGHDIRAFVRRRGGPALDILPEAAVFLGDLARPDTFPPAVAGVEAIIHCAAATSAGAPDIELSRRVNVEGTARLLRAASECNPDSPPRWIQISSMSAHPGSTSVYGRTKLGADEAVRASALPWTILRPSLIYGPGDRGLVSKTLAIMRRLPVVPVVGSGREMIRPVLASDVGAAALACIEAPSTIGRTYMIGGADEITFNEFLRRLAEATGLRRPLIHVPIPVALLLATALGFLSRNPPITVDNVLGIREAQSVEIGPAMADFGFQPRSLEEGLRVMFAL
jgi:nucleoside-diphosphate-sugar epimerase